MRRAEAPADRGSPVQRGRAVADRRQRAYEGLVGRGRAGFALVALLAMTPGLHELVEATVHAVAVDPATESAIVHHQEHEDSERSCSGVFHVWRRMKKSASVTWSRPSNSADDANNFSNFTTRRSDSPIPSERI